MNKNQINELINIVQIYRPNFELTPDVIKEWKTRLEPYEYIDVFKKLEEWLKDGANDLRIPNPINITKGLRTLKQKEEANNFLQACPICGRFIKDFDKHFDKCSSVDFISTNYRKYYNSNIDKGRLWNLPENEFKEMYNKFVKQLVAKVEDGNFKQSLLEGIQRGIYE